LSTSETDDLFLGIPEFKYHTFFFLLYYDVVPQFQQAFQALGFRDAFIASVVKQGGCVER